jgi:hypothetical protein
MEHVKTNIYLLLMGIAMYALSLYAKGHIWAHIMQSGTVICLIAIGLIFAVSLLRSVFGNASSLAREAKADAKPKAMPRQARNVAQ